MSTPPDNPVSALVCTGNAHKVEELAALLPGLDLVALPAGTQLPPETATTFVGNARIKALGGREHAPDGAWVIADDSGLVVDALDGAPGVYSARFAGEDASDGDNTNLLLERIAHLDDSAARSARFVCVLVAIAPDGTEIVAEGTVEGRIAHAPSGSTGFGYDPVFIPHGHDASFAELGADIKASISHRARAAQALAHRLTWQVDA